MDNIVEVIVLVKLGVGRSGIGRIAVWGCDRLKGNPVRCAIQIHGKGKMQKGFGNGIQKHPLQNRHIIQARHYIKSVGSGITTTVQVIAIALEIRTE